MIELKYKEGGYPDRLRQIEKYPKKIYVQGNCDLLNSIGIAVIGSRVHSKYGERMCKNFVKELTEYGVTIISGLAEGIDTIAHTTCLENGGNTIAVLPCGVNNIFPKQNKKLARDIINSGGTIVTEYSPNTSAESKKFLERNRIVAGLAMGTLVVEAGNRSGTSVTARLTMEQNKNVFCIPSSLENKRGITSNEIIQRGGKLVTCLDDILKEFEEIEFAKRTVSTEGTVEIAQEYIEVYNLLSDEAVDIDEIAKNLNSSIKEVSYKLMMLELEGHIVQLPGKKFIKGR